MTKCDECGKEAEVRHNPKWGNNICRQCVRDELIGNAEKNKALGSLLSPAAMAAGYKAADMIFDKLLPKPKEKEKEDLQKASGSSEERPPADSAKTDQTS